MFTKSICFAGQSATVSCDGLCVKAWGRNSRPKVFYIEPSAPPRALRKGEEPPDLDDYAYLADGELGQSPEDPRTYEGDAGKPVGAMSGADMNRWCVRECERCVMTEPGQTVNLLDFSQPLPNKWRRRLPVTNSV